MYVCVCVPVLWFSKWHNTGETWSCNCCQTFSLVTGVNLYIRGHKERTLQLLCTFQYIDVCQSQSMEYKGMNDIEAVKDTFISTHSYIWKVYMNIILCCNLYLPYIQTCGLLNYCPYMKNSSSCKNGFIVPSFTIPIAAINRLLWTKHGFSFIYALSCVYGATFHAEQ